MKAQTRSEIVDLLERHGLTPTHHLGQNFLADSNITRKIVDLAGLHPGDRVVEVGAGTGTLTRALAATGSQVVAYEVDSKLAPVLEEVTAGLDVELRFADVMDVDLGGALGPGRWVMVANLPYNVGTPLVLDALRSVPDIVRFVVMVQREVAERFAASPGGKEYGLPSVICGIYAPARVAFRVPPQVFYPAPSVESAVVIMDRVPAPPDADRAVELAGAGFNQRRKMLRRSLDQMFEDPTASIRAAGLDPTARAEDLAPADYLRLARV
ncbi:MAG TPA: 16S rRNA (adenine(1518)-N(6)/adenine(1519)-N(6))-dimethyltransferase RsmA [Acidimicrobiia bacterium]